MKRTLPFLLKATWVALAVLLGIAISMAYAAPMPPRTLINHKTHQCAQITPGDECGDVVLPPDWEYLDTASGEKCPDNYTFIDLHPKWTHFKAQVCCSEGHSGSAGDCQDVVIQPTSRQCAFVEDIQKCTNLPVGWKAWGQNCPAGFKWSETIVCTNGESNPTENLTSGNQTVPTAALQPTAEPPADQTTPASSADKRNPLFPCASSALVLIILFGVTLRRR